MVRFPRSLAPQALRSVPATAPPPRPACRGAAGFARSACMPGHERMQARGRHARTAHSCPPAPWPSRLPTAHRRVRGRLMGPGSALTGFCGPGSRSQIYPRRFPRHERPRWVPSPRGNRRRRGRSTPVRERGGRRSRGHAAPGATGRRSSPGWAASPAF